LAVLDHENLVRLHALLETDDTMVLVLDLADGGSMADLLAARRRLTPGEVITALAPVAAAVAYLHDAGIVHGDISPSNILFNASGVPMLCDVGVARITGDDTDAAAPPAYVDPAVAAGCVPGPQSDVFMLGGVALHALTGSPPWPDGDAELAIARAALGVLDDVPARLAAADVPDAMSAVVCRALTVDPRRRGTAADFTLDLRHTGEPVAVELAAGRTGPAADAFVRPGPRHAARRPADDPARPAFERPGEKLPDSTAPSPPPTRMIAARPRPVIPRPVRRRRVRLPIVAAASALLVAALVVILVARRPHIGTAGRAMSTPRAEVETQVRQTGAPRSRPPSAPAGWLAKLDGLDRYRARAYATRDIRALRQVYARGPLLRRDAALLADLVPIGCHLSGVRTRYATPLVHRTAGRVHITVRATLLPSRLMCGGRLRGHAAGQGPTTLHIELVRTPGGLRIVAQRAD
jgi:hypothetical protein